MKQLKVIFIGLWPYAKKTHYSFLKAYVDNGLDIQIELLVDLKSKEEEIMNFIKDKNFYPKRTYFVDDRNRDAKIFEQNLETLLNRVILEQKIDMMIISTEPKAHSLYLTWAMKHDIHILVDKPLITEQSVSTHKEKLDIFHKDFNRILEFEKQSPSVVTVNAQRRCHPWFTYVKQYLSEVVSKYNVPISFIGVNHCDGTWNMPNELIHRENHPYKYGYGKIMHSGYHFLDTLTWFLDVNEVSSKKIDTYDVYTTCFRPSDFLHQINIEQYRELFKDKKLYEDYQIEKIDGYWELDTSSLIQFKGKKQEIITTASLNLLQNGFSRRAWAELPDDTYKWNGRLRHENWNIQVWPLLNIQIHSYESFEWMNKIESDNFISSYETWSKNHFDICIYRNAGLIGGEAFEKISLGEKYPDLMWMARKALFHEFLTKRAKSSLLKTHKRTNELIHAIYGNMCRSHVWEVPYSGNILY
jgi:predicted dehydrogenase